MSVQDQIGAHARIVLSRFGAAYLEKVSCPASEGTV
jgi:hypothetical protein